MPIPNPAVYMFDKSWSVSILCLWKVGKVSRLHGSSDIQSGLQRDQTSPPSHLQSSRGIKEIFLNRTRLCEMCSFCPWRHTRHLWSLLHLLCMCESLSAPSSFPSRHRPAQGTGQPAGGSVESQANTGPAWQTSHLCVCMGTSGPPRLTGPSVCLPVWQWAYRYCWCVPVLSWHQNFYSYTGTGSINKNNHYNTKANKPNVPKQQRTVIVRLLI